MTENEVKEQAALLLCIAAAEQALYLNVVAHEYGFADEVRMLAWSRFCHAPTNLDPNTVRLLEAERLLVEVYS